MTAKSEAMQNDGATTFRHSAAA